MKPIGDPPNPTSWQYAFSSRALVVGGEVGCLTVFIVLASVLGGLWLDNILGTKPLITLILVLASAPLSIVLTFWIARRAVKDLSATPSAGKQKEEVTEGENER